MLDAIHPFALAIWQILSLVSTLLARHPILRWPGNGRWYRRHGQDQVVLAGRGYSGYI